MLRGQGSEEGRRDELLTNICVYLHSSLTVLSCIAHVDRLGLSFQRHYIVIELDTVMEWFVLWKSLQSVGAGS